jgi:xylulokinase
MSEGAYILTHDVGTTNNKTCLYRLGETIALVDSALADYPLYTAPGGEAEQDAHAWWSAVCQATRTVIGRSGIDPAQIQGMAFCAQMQAFVPVDARGQVLRRPMIYMDQRATLQMERGLQHGFPRIEGWNAYKTLRSLQITGGLSASVKDPLWKYHWMRENEPQMFARLYKWLDVKDYLVWRSTAVFSMGVDSAHATFLCDTRPGKIAWSEPVCQLFDVSMDHLPPIIQSTDVAGELTAAAAQELGLVPGIPVFGGGGDLSLIAIGAGCLDLYDAHIYIGTSGWLASTVDKRMTDIGGLIASILGAIPGWYNYIAEQETAGRCLQWVRDHLALDEIGIYLADNPYSDAVGLVENLYEFLNQEVERAAPGSGGLIFTPWLHGNRSPFEDPYARGIFFNIGLQTGKREMVRAVLEGVAYHMRWMLERVEKKVPHRESLRFVGGGAQSPAWAKILADVMGRRIEVAQHAQNAGTIGAAVVCAVGLGLLHSFQDASSLIEVERTYDPQSQHKALYDRNFDVYVQLYERNKDLFKKLNR